MQSFLDIISVGGNVKTSLPILYTPMVSSLPSIYSSISAYASTSNTASMAGSSASTSVTLVVAILEPPSLGFTNTGRLTFSKIVPREKPSSLKRCTDLAICTKSKSLTTLLQKLLLKVTADTIALQVV